MNVLRQNRDIFIYDTFLYKFTTLIINRIILASEFCLSLRENAYKRNINVCLIEMALCSEWTIY